MISWTLGFEKNQNDSIKRALDQYGSVALQHLSWIWCTVWKWWWKLILIICGHFILPTCKSLRNEQTEYKSSDRLSAWRFLRKDYLVGVSVNLRPVRMNHIQTSEHTNKQRKMIYSCPGMSARHRWCEDDWSCVIICHVTEGLWRRTNIIDQYAPYRMCCTTTGKKGSEFNTNL